VQILLTSKFLFVLFLLLLLLQNGEEFPGAVGGGVTEEEEFNLVKDKLHLLVKFLKLWTEWLPQDFRDDRLMHFVRILTRDCVDEDPEVIITFTKVCNSIKICITIIVLVNSILIIGEGGGLFAY
jgi:hypothetical protein